MFELVFGGLVVCTLGNTEPSVDTASVCQSPDHSLSLFFSLECVYFAVHDICCCIVTVTHTIHLHTHLCVRSHDLYPGG